MYVDSSTATKFKFLIFHREKGVFFVINFSRLCFLKPVRRWVHEKTWFEVADKPENPPSQPNRPTFPTYARLETSPVFWVSPTKRGADPRTRFFPCMSQCPNDLMKKIVPAFEPKSANPPRTVGTMGGPAFCRKDAGDRRSPLSSGTSCGVRLRFLFPALHCRPASLLLQPISLAHGSHAWKTSGAPLPPDEPVLFPCQ